MSHTYVIAYWFVYLSMCVVLRSQMFWTHVHVYHMQPVKVTTYSLHEIHTISEKGL